MFTVSKKSTLNAMLSRNRYPIMDIIDQAIAAEIISAQQADLVLNAEQARHAAIQVDDFAIKDLVNEGDQK